MVSPTIRYGDPTFECSNKFLNDGSLLASARIALRETFVQKSVSVRVNRDFRVLDIKLYYSPTSSMLEILW